MVKSPRTFHCPACDKCILRREKHSELIGGCVGANNTKIFIQYLFVAMVDSSLTQLASAFMTISLTMIAILGNSKLEELSDLQAVIFAVF